MTDSFRHLAFVRVEQNEADYSIKHLEQSLVISKSNFAKISPKFAALSDFYESNPLEIPDSVSFDALEELISAINTGQYQITSENAFDLLYLAELWKINEMIDEIRLFIRYNIKLEAIIENLDLNCPSDTILSIIAEQLDQAIRLESLNDLPNDILKQILLSPDRIVRNDEDMFFFLYRIREKLSDFYEDCLMCLNHSKISKDTLTLLMDPKNLPETAPKRNSKSSILSRVAALEEKLESGQLNSVVDSDFEKYVNLRFEKVALGFANTVVALEKKISDLSTNLEALWKKYFERETKNSIDLDMVKSNMMALKRSNETLKRTLDSVIVNMSTADSPVPQTMAVPFNGKPFEGLLLFLDEQLASPARSTASSEHVGHAAQLATTRQPINFVSGGNGEQWVMFDFSPRRALITHYTLMSPKRKSKLLKAWTLEGSNDLLEWSSIDSRVTRCISGPEKLQTFACASPTHFYRYVRLIVTQPHKNGEMSVSLARIEFFGAIELALTYGAKDISSEEEEEDKEAFVNEVEEEAPSQPAEEEEKVQEVEEVEASDTTVEAAPPEDDSQVLEE